MKLRFLIFILVLSLALFAETDLEKENLLGDVKSCNSKIFTSDKDSEDYEYNEHGYDTWMKFDLEGVITTYNYEYKYDEQGNWTEKIEYENDEPDIKEIREITYHE